MARKKSQFVEQGLLGILTDITPTASPKLQRDYTAALDRYNYDVAKLKRPSKLELNTFAEFPDEQIALSRSVLEQHVVSQKTPASIIESAIFCIISAGFAWENASRIIYSMRERSGVRSNQFASYDFLKDPKNVRDVLKENRYRFDHQDRTTPTINIITANQDYFLETIGTSNLDDRKLRASDKKDVGLRGMKDKTYSFWDLCCGGKDFLVLDRWVARKLYAGGFDYIEPKHIVERPRAPSENLDKIQS